MEINTRYIDIVASCRHTSTEWFSKLPKVNVIPIDISASMSKQELLAITTTALARGMPVPDNYDALDDVLQEAISENADLKFDEQRTNVILLIGLVDFADRLHDSELGVYLSCLADACEWASGMASEYGSWEKPAYDCRVCILIPSEAGSIRRVVNLLWS